MTYWWEEFEMAFKKSYRMLDECTDWESFKGLESMDWNHAKVF